MLKSRKKQRDRLSALIQNPPIAGGLSFPEQINAEANWAKYMCVLVSGYLEQSLKNICFYYAEKNSNELVLNYIEKTWPQSANMKIHKILEIIECFDCQWKMAFSEWIDENGYKKNINSLVQSRNDISHGNDANTNNVTILSVTQNFEIVNDVLGKLDELFSIPTEE